MVVYKSEKKVVYEIKSPKTLSQKHRPSWKSAEIS